MSWRDRTYAGIGEYLRKNGRDCVEVLTLDESSNNDGIYTVVQYKDKDKNCLVTYINKSLADIINDSD